MVPLCPAARGCEPCAGGRCVPGATRPPLADANGVVGTGDGGGTCVGPNTPCAGVTGGVVNMLKGSRKRSADRPHVMVIDADFVTCTQ